MENQHDKQLREAIYLANQHYNNPRENIIHMLNAISELNLVDWVRDFKYSDRIYYDKNFQRICDHPYMHRDDFSVSCERCMLTCQLILQGRLV